MKKLLLIVRIALGLCVGTALVTVPTACVTPKQTIVYNSLYSVEQSTTAAFDAYLDLVVAGKVKQDGVPTVSKAYNRFQIGMQTAITAAQFNWQAPAPSDVVALATEVLNAITKAKGL